ncbi:uncharacterized protein BXZ73DRAFT_95768 [Epithele typhae]|uniref:uncharacterized protein n=1 Tax=Epithele typhae TaxID=378194 RepID=UPI002008BC19|nr:uncharacterized protein BXZ73DRAFT_95768 [Epithele typhae]KAH9946266.1 hypothetical protein BXZ73DRAFT_95768 [Epithele typhae]
MSSPLRALSPPSSLSSYEFFSYQPHARTQPAARAISSDSDSYASLSDPDDGSSDDEILLSFSDLSSADFRSQRAEPRTPAVFSDDEFVIMSRPRSPASASASDDDDLTASFSALSVSVASTRSSRRRAASNGAARAPSSTIAKAPAPSSPAKSSDGAASPKRRNRKRQQASNHAPDASHSPNADAAASQNPGKAASDLAKRHSPSKARRKARRAAARAAMISPSPAAGLGDRPIVDDVSEAGSEYLYVPPELYKSAQRYVSSVLSADPTTKAELSKLEFLQALIIELGLFTGLSALPSSMRAAKALLKSQAFVNVRDYLAVRSEGVDALRSIMHPSRSALLRDIRGGRKTPAKTVKETGLSVLLVTCYR